jgi:ABC-type sugar transport system permease subunit
LTAYALVAAGLSVAVWAAALRQGNQALRAVNEKDALTGASMLLHPLNAAGTERAALARVLKDRDSIVPTAAVVAERPKTENRPFATVELIAHTDPSFAPGDLRQAAKHKKDRRRAKQIHDWAIRVLATDEAQVKWFSEPGRPEQVAAAVPLDQVRGGRIVLMVWTEPVAKSVAWPVTPWLFALFMPALLLGFWLWRRPDHARWPACAGACFLCWLLCTAWLSGFVHFTDRWIPVAYGGQGVPGFMQILAAGFDHLLEPGWVMVLSMVCAVFAAAVVAVGSTGLGARLAKALAAHRVAYAYVLPAAAGMLVLVLVPFLMGLGLGFFNHCEGRFEFVGLSNFSDILSGGGAPLTHPLNFYFTLAVTLLWTSLNVFLHLSIGLAVALLLRDPMLHLKGIYRVLLIIPWAVPNYITALMWKGMFHQQYGAVNQVLSLVGIEPVSWFSSFWTAFTANVVTNTWLGFPFMMVVCLGALQSIPADLYEAADVDGAGRWKSFVHITLPLIRPALLPAVVLGSIWTFNMFNIIYLVSAGEPGGSTDILITEAYRWAFIRYERYGLAAAYATLIFVILLGYTYLTGRATRASKEAVE